MTTSEHYENNLYNIRDGRKPWEIEETVKALESLLMQAKTGAVRSVAVVYSDSKDSWSSLTIGPRKPMVYALEWLKHDITK